MSLMSVLANQSRTLRATEKSTVSAVSAAAMFVTLSGWTSAALLSRIRVASTAAVTNPTITILSDAAGYRAAITADKSKFILAQRTATVSALTYFEIDFDEAYVEDALRAGCLYVMISAGSAFTTGTVFTVTAEGRAQQPSTRTDSDRTGVRLDKSFRVLRTDGATNLTSDITKGLLNNSDPYTIGGANESLRLDFLSATSDVVYVGSVDPITALAFILPDVSKQAATNGLTLDYWNGTAWTTATFLDNTSDGQTSPSTMSYSGTVAIPAISAWRKSQLSIDPMKIMADSIDAGTSYAMGSFVNPSRYWLRIKMASQSAPLKVVSLRPLY